MARQFFCTVAQYNILWLSFTYSRFVSCLRSDRRTNREVSTTAAQGCEHVKKLKFLGRVVTLQEGFDTRYPNARTVSISSPDTSKPQGVNTAPNTASFFFNFLWEHLLLYCRVSNFFPPTLLYEFTSHTGVLHPARPQTTRRGISSTTGGTFGTPHASLKMFPSTSLGPQRNCMMLLLLPFSFKKIALGITLQHSLCDRVRPSGPVRT